jgi:hypothetical protein
LLDKALIELRFQVNFLFRYEPEKVERYLPQVKRKPGRKALPNPGGVPSGQSGQGKREEERGVAE